MAAIASTTAPAEIHIAASCGARGARCGGAPAIEIEIDRPVGPAMNRVLFVGEVRQRRPHLCRPHLAPDHDGRRILVQHAEARGRTVN